MKHASRAASLLAAALAGCGADLSLPEGARIECDEQRPCPAPLVCAVRVARCVPAQGGDRETPSVVSGSVRIEPDPAALGALVEVSFLVSEPLATAPRLTLDTADATPLAVVEADGPAYRYGYRPSGGEPAGPVNVLATLVDRSGNLAADLTLGSVTFDFGAPRVLRVVAPDGTRIREGATARIELTVSEPLAAPPTVTLSGRDEPLAPDPGVEPPVYQVVHEVTPADGEGPKDVVVLATDLAGNTGRHEVEALLWFDLTPPGIDGEVVLSNRVARPGTVVGVALSASEPLGADPVVALEREAGDARLPMTLEEAAGSSYVFTHEVAPGQDGRYRVVIDLVDRSGLRSRVSPEQGFVLDTTPPVIADGRLTTVPVVSGLYGEPVLAVGTVHTLRASFTLREDRGLLPDSPLVFLDTNAGPLPFEQVERVRQPDPGVEACTFELSLDADTRSQVEGVLGWPVRVVAEDEAGNRTVEAELAGEPVRVDVSPPEAECLQNRLVAKPADRLRVDAHFSEPVRPGSVGPVCWEEGDGQERPCGPDELEGEAAEPRGTPPHFAWGYTVPADGLASWRFSLQAQDLVGNAGAGGLVCDVTVPIDRESIGVRDGSVTVTTGEGAQRRATGGFARNGARVEVRFTAGEPPAPGSLHVRLGGIELDVAAREEQEDGSVDLVFEHVVEGVEPEDLEGDDPPNPAEPEGSVPVSLEMADAAGNVTVESLGSVVRDYRGPRLVGQPYFERADGYERARLGEDGYVVRTGDTVEVSFALGEPVAAGVPDAVVITVAGVRVATLQPEEQEQTHFTASLTNAAGAWPEGDADVHVLALDRAGNLGDRRLGRIRSDYGRPAPLDGLRQPRVRLYRAPVGSQETGGTPLIELRGCPPPPGAEDEESWAWCPRDEDGGPSPDAAFEPAAQVDVWEVTHEGGLACDDRLVRTGTADPDTGTLRLPLPGDRAAVCVTQTDVSGQTSLRAVVRHGQWLATLGGKVPGSTAENPHRLLHVTRFDEAMLRQPGRESEPADVGRVALPAEEDEAERVLTVAGDREWRYLETYAAAPEPLAGQTIAWDPIHGRTVYLAGGRPWFWLGDAWREAPVDATPGFVYEPVFAFDAARGRLVLFGGASFDEGRPLRDETWESDGTGWVLVNRDGDRPLHRYGHAGAYDPRRARLVVHGGYGFGRGVEPGILSDLWEWDGEAWEPREPEGDAPPALFGHSMVWSASRRAVLLYGGCRQAQPQVAGHEPLCTAYSRQLWEWDGESWSPAPDPGDPPPPRQYAGMAYDSGRDRVVLFGGLYVDLLGGEATFRDDLWEWDGERWEERHPPGGRPRGRVNHALGYDPADRRTVLVGGRVSLEETCDDTWLWDGTRWMQATGRGPPGRKGHSLVWEGAGGRAVLFGGWGAGTELLADTWEWRYPAWTPVEVQGQTPTARWGHAAVPDGDGLLLFGGCGRLGPSGELGEAPACEQAHDDTWRWDGAAWSRLAAGDPAPPARLRHGMVPDLEPGRTLVFGGFTDTDADGEPDARTNDLWAWDGAGWQEVPQAGEWPPPFTGPALVRDPLRDEIVMFGGERDDENLPGVGTGEIWAWDGVAWRHQGRAWDWPWPRSGHVGLWDPLRARSLFLWGWDEVAGWLLDLAEWDGVTWRDVTPRGDAYPMSRRWTGLALDPDRRRLLAFGGDVVGVSAHDTWELTADPDDRPALVLDVDFDFPGASSCDLEGVTVVAVAGGTGHTVDDDPADGDLVGEPVPGVELLGWEAWEGAWTSLGSEQHAADGPAELSWDSPDAATARRLLLQRDRTLHVALRPLGGTGNGPGPAELGVDYVEVRVRYTVAGGEPEEGP